METQPNRIKWKSVVWAAVLMFIIPMLISFLIPAVYATYVGFSTRGDPAQINAAVQSVGNSILYRVILYAVFAAVALWRSYVLVKKVVTQHLLHIGIAVLIAAVLVLAFYIIMSQGALSAIVEALIFSVLIAGGAYLGTLLKPTKAAQA